MITSIPISAQLLEAGRVNDLEGQKLNLDFLKECVSFLHNNRENSTTVDAICAEATASRLVPALKRDIEFKYGEIAAGLLCDNGVSGNGYVLFDVPEAGAKLAVISDQGITDFLAADW